MSEELDRELRSEHVECAIASGLEFLKRSQLPSGSFALYRSYDPALEEGCVDDPSPFGTALIAYCLTFLDCATARQIVERAAAFFLDEMTGPGLWRYWTSNHPYYRNIPPDLDDIACISLVLRRQGVEFPDNRRLILSTRNPAGLFYTWLIPRFRPLGAVRYWRYTFPQLLRPIPFVLFWTLFSSRPADVDGVVNANVLFYLGDGPTMRPVVDYLVGIIERRREATCDKWHRNRFTFYYALSRNLASGVDGFDCVRETMVQRICEALRGDDGDTMNVLDTALAACALMNCGAAPAELYGAMRTLLAAQRAGGEWGAFPMYYGGPVNSPGYGSEELTSGFCLEALTRFAARDTANPYATGSNAAAIPLVGKDGGR
jgi:hypothetical protein